MKKKHITEQTLCLQMRDGVTVSCAYLQSPNPKAVVIFSMGFAGEVSHYRRMFYTLLQASDVALYCITCRGQSSTNENYFHIEDEDLLVGDMEELYSHIELAHREIPIYVCAHSGGSALAIKLVTSRVGLSAAGLFLIEPVFAGDMEVCREHPNWLYKMVHLWFQGKLVDIPDHPKVEDKWTYKFSMLRYELGLIFPFIRRSVYLRVKPDNDSPWQSYTGNYMRGYAMEYSNFELKSRLKNVHCPVWIAMGESDEYSYPDGIRSLLNWHLPPGKLRDFRLFKGITHFGTLTVAGSVISRWLKTENAT